MQDAGSSIYNDAFVSAPIAQATTIPSRLQFGKPGTEGISPAEEMRTRSGARVATMPLFEGCLACVRGMEDDCGIREAEAITPECIRSRQTRFAPESHKANILHPRDDRVNA